VVVMIMRIQIALVFAAAVALSGCSPGISDGSKEASAGSADFSTFVAIGDSLTAGYADGALYRDIQQYSLALIMAQQFALAGGGEFDQPLMPVGATGSLNFAGTDLDRPDRVVLAATPDPENPLSPQTITPVQSTDIQVRVDGAGMFSNMGIPGMKSFHMMAPGYGTLSLAAIGGGLANPYFARFASSDATSVVADINAQMPSFFTFWVGANDILLYALDGGTQTNAPATDPPYGLTTIDMTDPAVFALQYNAALAAVKNASNKGVLVNIPEVATIPHFTTIPFDSIPLTASQVNDLATLTGGYDTVLNIAVGANLIDADEAERRRINYQEGQNPILISDESLVDLSGILIPPFDGLAALNQARPATAEDFILLTTLSKLGEEQTPGDPSTKWGVTLPLADRDALVKLEVQQIETARVAYNATIKAAADADPDLLFFDAAAKLRELNDSGIDYGSGTITSEFATGGGFSLDGVHPTARGYAVIANEIFRVINAGFDAFIPGVDPNDYPTVPIQ